jgi:hypothetical protein
MCESGNLASPVALSLLQDYWRTWANLSLYALLAVMPTHANNRYGPVKPQYLNWSSQRTAARWANI